MEMDLNIVENSTLGEGTEVAEFTVVHDSEFGDDCTVWRFCNIYGAEIGDDCMIGSLVEIQEDVVIGDGCRVQSHAFLCSLVELKEEVFVSHGVKFVNDVYPPSGDPEEWEETVVGEGASIGTNATVLPAEISEALERIQERPARSSTACGKPKGTRQTVLVGGSCFRVPVSHRVRLSINRWILGIYLTQPRFTNPR